MGVLEPDRLRWALPLTSCVASGPKCLHISRREIMAPPWGLVVVRKKWDIKCLLPLPFDCNKIPHLQGTTDEDWGEGTWLLAERV